MAADVVKIDKEPDPADLDLKAWFSSMGGGADVEVSVTRVQPASWKLPTGRIVQIAGKIPGALYNDMIDEEFIEQTFGGGLYRLGVKRRNPEGRMVFWKQKNVKISGDPIVDPGLLATNAYQPDEDKAAPATVSRLEPHAENPTLAMHAFDTVKEVIDDMRADRNRGSSNGFDATALEMMMRPFTAQLEQIQKANVELQKALAEKDAKIFELLARKPDTTTQDTLIGRMWDSESGRIEAIRTQHASELNAMRASYEAREKSLATQHERDLQNKENDHKRLLDTVIDNHKQSVKNLETVHAVQVETLKTRAEDLKSTVTELKSKVAALEAIKQQTVLDKAKEVQELKELFNGGEDDRDDKPSGLWGTIQTIAEGVIENPEVLGTLVGARGGPPPAPPQETRVARMPDGRVVRVAAPAPRPAVVGQPAAPVLAAAPTPGPVFAAPAQAPDGVAPQPVPQIPAAPAPVPPSPAEIAVAVLFLENACKSGQDPEVVAASARSLVQADVLAYLEKVGVDELLNRMTTLDPGSPLRTVQGRNFVRKVAKTLLTGSAE